MLRDVSNRPRSSTAGSELGTGAAGSMSSSVGLQLTPVTSFLRINLDEATVSSLAGGLIRSMSQFSRLTSGDIRTARKQLVKHFIMQPY